MSACPRCERRYGTEADEEGDLSLCCWTNIVVAPNEPDKSIRFLPAWSRAACDGMTERLNQQRAEPTGTDKWAYGAYCTWIATFKAPHGPMRWSAMDEQSRDSWRAVVDYFAKLAATEW